MLRNLHIQGKLLISAKNASDGIPGKLGLYTRAFEMENKIKTGNCIKDPVSTGVTLLNQAVAAMKRLSLFSLLFQFHWLRV